MRIIFIFISSLCFVFFVNAQTTNSNGEVNEWLKFFNRIEKQQATGNPAENSQPKDVSTDKTENNASFNRKFFRQQPLFASGEKQILDSLRTQRQQRRRNKISSTRWLRRLQRKQWQQQGSDNIGQPFQYMNQQLDVVSQKTQNRFMGHANGGKGINKQGDIAAQLFVNADKRNKLFKSNRRGKMKQLVHFEGIVHADYERAEWNIQVPVNKNNKNKTLVTREVTYFSREKKQLTVITSNRLKKTGYSSSTSMRDYKTKLMAIKAFTNGGLSCFIGDISDNFNDTIDLVQQRNSSTEFVTPGKEKNFTASPFNDTSLTLSEDITRFCTTRYGDIKIYRLLDHTPVILYVQEEKVLLPVYEKYVIVNNRPFQERIKIIDLYKTLNIHL